MRHQCEDIRNYLELLMYRLEVMRSAQIEAGRMPTETKRKKTAVLELQVDKALEELKRRGFTTDHIRQRAEQKKLF